MLAAEPNAAHNALAQLEAAGRLQAVITQNIDALHQRAGSRRVLELHGTNLEAVCLRCEARAPIQEALAALEAGVEVPTCARCGGWLKPATVSFGQALPADVLGEATELAQRSDALLALGSSLLVTPAASLAGLAKQCGGALIIINFDRDAIRSRCRCGAARESRGGARRDHGSGAAPGIATRS